MCNTGPVFMESNSNPESAGLNVGARVVIARQHLDDLLGAIARLGFKLLGPAVRGDAISYGPISCAADLPIGWTDEQDGARYRLKRRADEAVFGFSNGPQSWKNFLLPPEQRIFKARKEAGGIVVESEPLPQEKLAFIGARACDLHAIAILDKVLGKRAFSDPAYLARRRNVFLLAVNCSQAGGTCFCASTRSGPRAASGFDIALTELLGNGRHVFLAEAGTPLGAQALSETPHAPATQAEFLQAEQLMAATSRQMGRIMETRGLKEMLYRNYDNSRWEDVGARCLACGNCTLVCPTCYCTKVEDTTDLTGENAGRWRKWDTCFSLAFSGMNGGHVRKSTASRYRHWLMHKLATWQDQFGSIGCVGCGRCITWCPVGIDLTEEVRTIRENEPLQARTMTQPL